MKLIYVFKYQHRIITFDLFSFHFRSKKHKKKRKHEGDSEVDTRMQDASEHGWYLKDTF